MPRKEEPSHGLLTAELGRERPSVRQDGQVKARSGSRGFQVDSALTVGQQEHRGPVGMGAWSRLSPPAHAAHSRGPTCLLPRPQMVPKGLAVVGCSAGGAWMDSRD